ncbi:uncharacterized protein Hap1MRO34_018399 isoform 1-T1 [Clarias gariepinus]
MRNLWRGYKGVRTPCISGVTMTKFSHICIMWISSCVYLLSAEPEISVSGPVGSTAVLPCELMSVDTDRLYIRWNIKSETVFERQNGAKYEGEGYEGRVDVPVEELRKGNCSLVLHNLTFTDTGVYTSYQTVRHTKRSVRVRRGTVLINSVNLSVYDRTEERSASSEKTEERSDNSSGSSDNGGRNRLYSLSLIFLVFLLCGVIVSLIKKKISYIQ